MNLNQDTNRQSAGRSSFYYLLSVASAFLLSIIIYELFSLRSMHPTGDMAIYIIGIIYMLLIIGVLLWAGGMSAFSSACPASNAMTNAAVSAVIACISVITGLFFTNDIIVILTALFAALSILPMGAVVTFFNTKKKGLASAVVISSFITIVLWLSAYAMLVLSYHKGFTAQSIVKPIDDLYAMYITLIESAKTSTLFPVNQTIADAAIRSLQENRISAPMLLPGGVISTAFLAAFLSVVCCVRALKRTGQQPSLEPISEFRMDKVGAVIYMIVATVSVFYSFSGSADAVYFVILNIMSILFVPYTVAGFGALYAIMKLFNAKKSTITITFLVIIASSLIQMLNLIIIITFLGVWDAFVDYRKKLVR